MKHYVYQHVDPRDSIVRYIGKGTAGRAWACGWSVSKAHEGRRGNRTEDHQKWIKELLSLGFTPADWVRIINQRMTNDQARDLERKLVNECQQPDLLFNLLDTTHRCTGLTKNQLLKAVQLRESGVAYQTIADQIGASAMTVHRALNGRTKGYQQWLTN